MFSLFAVFLLSDAAVFGGLPATSVSYTIQVKLDPSTRILTGQEKLTWVNRSSESVAAVPLHLYLNGFLNTRSTWMREASRFVDPEEVSRDFPDPWGYSDPKKIEQKSADGIFPLKWKAIQPDDGNPLDRTLIEVALARPVEPGQSLELDINFEARLPAPIARTGGYRGFFLVGQWFPKIGVLETPGVRHAKAPRWAARQFHGVTEFYSDFADYDVTIQVPEDYVIGATGRRQPDSRPGSHHYRQQAVIDFAFVAGLGLRSDIQSVQRSTGGNIEVHFLYPEQAAGHVTRVRAALWKAIEVMEKRVAPYPYDTLTVVFPPFRAIETTGMEYPTFVTGFTGDRAWDVPPLRGVSLQESTLVHEYAHQYFYGMVASNEQEEAFLDEGMTSYWEYEILDELYGQGRPHGYVLQYPMRWTELAAQGLESRSAIFREPINKSPSSLYYPRTWGGQVYERVPMMMRTASLMFGSKEVDHVFAEYFRRYSFGHPDAEDFLAVAGEAGSTGLEAFLREGFSAERVPDYSVKSATSVSLDPPLGLFSVNGKWEEAKDPSIGLDPGALEKDGRILVEITDPGWSRASRSQEGTVIHDLRKPARKESTEFEADDTYYETSVQLDGPAWDHLPVDVEFQFADGITVTDRWDGKSSWRAYRFLRKAPLKQVWIDPGGKIALDVKPQNNSLALRPDARFVDRWSLRFGFLLQWLATVVSLWT